MSYNAFEFEENGSKNIKVTARKRSADGRTDVHLKRFRVGLGGVEILYPGTGVSITRRYPLS